MNLHWPQLLWLALLLFCLGIELQKHGQPRKGNHNFGATLIALGFNVWLLWEGGFFVGASP